MRCILLDPEWKFLIGGGFALVLGSISLVLPSARTIPKLVWVGIGSPRQERWIAEHAGKVGAPVLIAVGAAFDYLYLKGAENGLDDVPVELSNPQITADGTAYRMTPHKMDFIMNAAVLMLKPEIGYTFHRWHLGGGKTLGIKGFLGLHAGLFAGSVYDDGCSYSYDPAGDDTIHVSPTGGGSAVVVQETELGTRCRSGEPVFGSIFGAEIGFGVEWGL